MTEHDEGSGGIIFARHAITARRLGANKYADGEFGYVNCRRAPWADRYADTRDVPISVMVEAGWHFECGGCGARIDSDMLWERDLEPEDLIGTQHSVAYCNAVCEAHERLRRAEAKHRERRWIRRFRKIIRARFPDATVVPGEGIGGSAHALAGKQKGRWVVEQVAVLFEFPGMTIAPATLRYNRADRQWRLPGSPPPKPSKPHWECCTGDRAAFEAWAAKSKAAA